ncbi:MAG: hypothetical protein RLZZ08_111 [Pseudomonadota bacterium]|jgi:O-antigen/teichoic acid export membrane protein
MPTDKFALPWGSNANRLGALLRRPAEAEVGAGVGAGLSEGANAAADRAHARNRQIAGSAAMAMVAKVVSVATALISVPLTLHYLGPERYGMWMVMSSLMAMLTFADLGIGNGLLNSVAAAHGRDDEPAIRRAISSGMSALALVAVVILGGLAVVYPLVAWHRLFNVQTALARAEAGPAIATFLICFALAIPAGVVQRVQMALQRGFLSSAWQCAGSVLSLAGVVMAIAGKAGLPVLVLAFAGGPLLANIANSLVFFTAQQPGIAPHPRAATMGAAREVMRTGALFLVLQVAAAVTYNAHNVLIAQILGPETVAQFAVPERMFSMITMLASMALAPLWPAYREAIVRRDMDWMKRTLRRSIITAVLFAAALSIPLVALAPWILRWWVNGAVQAPFALIAGLGLWKIIEAAGLALAMFLNGAHVVKPQVIAASATAIVGITLEIVFLQWLGIAGSVWATIIAVLLFALLPYAILTPQIIRRVAEDQGKVR